MAAGPPHPKDTALTHGLGPASNEEVTAWPRALGLAADTGEHLGVSVPAPTALPSPLAASSAVGRGQLSPPGHLHAGAVQAPPGVAHTASPHNKQ